MNTPQFESAVSTQPDYRLRRDDGIDIISERARNRASRGNPVAVGTCIVFRSHREIEQFIVAAERDGFIVERRKTL